MCLLVFSFRQHPEYRLIFAGNRDEAHVRPSEPAHFWPDHPEILAGRDLVAGGSWLGISRTGRFATVTNFREPSEHRPDARSRGELVSGFLLADDEVAYLREVAERGAAYNGFNLIVGGPSEMFYYSNVDGPPRTLAPGTYGLSNGLLDTPWPKVRRARSLFEEVVARGVDPDALLDVLADRTRAPDSELPDTGIGREQERAASSIFVDNEEYGTRASTVVLIGVDGQVTFVERTFDASGEPTGTRRFDFEIESHGREQGERQAL